LSQHVFLLISRVETEFVCPLALAHFLLALSLFLHMFF
jgi:hypothetical protein